MKYDIMSQTAKLLQQYKKNKRWLAVFLCLAVTVVLGTLAALKLYGQAMTHKVKVLECKYEVHEHTEECYDAENGEELICVYADYVVHVHNDDCYDAEGKLVCPLEEVEPHEHTEECYEEVKVLVCGKEAGEIEEGENAGAEGTSQNNEAAQEPVRGDLICIQEEHAHGEDCYSRTLTCETEEHTHGTECKDEEGNLACTTEEHTHGENCYNKELTCTTEEHAHDDSCYQWITPEQPEVPETKGHVHTDECYVTEKVLACGKLELHTHTDECYAKESFDEEGRLIEGSLPVCGLLQLEEHVHGEECFVTVELTPEEVEALEDGAALHVHDEKCYDEEGNLICGHEATHIHGPECYDDAGKVICGQGLGAHVHEAKCYNEEGKLICGYETAAHPHVAGCYDAEGNLQCGYETAAHVHEESCYDEEGNVICGYAAASHVHGKECYDENGSLACGYETAKHVHEDSCYDQEGNLICGYNENGLAASALYCDESIHTHDADCYDAEGNLICGKADFAVHKHSDDCYNINGVLICPLPEVEAHVHGAECYPEETAEGGAEPACGRQEIRLHTHTEDCYDENGALICGQLEILEHVHSEACKTSERPITKTFEGESFIVTAVYKPDANIPEEAELIAEQITEESDSEHFAKRQAEYQEALGDSKATMRALLKVGFYVNGEEVEPESPVTLTIQFLDENGLAEGKPVTVIHFADEGAEVLEGSEVQDGSTTFEMDSFSEIGVGDGEKSVRVPIDEELKYETDEFEVTFHIEGEVSVPVGNTKPVEEAGVGEENAESGDPAEETEESSTGSDAVTDEAGTEDAETSEDSESGEVEDNENEEADTAIAEGGVSVIIENDALEKILEFRVDPLSEEAEEYAKAAAAVYADGTDEAEEFDDQLFLQVLSYKVLYDGQKLDLSDCTITVEVKPSEALVEYAETAVDPMTLDLYGEEQVADGLEVKPEVVISVAEPKGNAGEGMLLDAMVVGQKQKIDVTVSNSDAGIMTIAGTSQANPEFTVQYYAYIDTFSSDGNYKLNLIDTSGGLLPKNNGTNGVKTKAIYVNTANKDVNNKILTEKKLTEVYRQKEYSYITAPSLVYFNRLAENNNYSLNEIWVCGESANAVRTTTDEDGVKWSIYPYHSHTKECYQEGTEGEGNLICGKEERVWHFTNKEETVKEEKDFILIKKDTVIRLVCDVTENTDPNAARFFDYDVSDGNLYNTANKDDIYKGGRESYISPNDKNKKWWMRTDKQGINSNGNTLAFGNSEGSLSTGLGGATWTDQDNVVNTLNAGNSNGYNNCTFGLVTGLTDKNVDYADGVNPPNLFDDGGANGKTSYDGSLTFRRRGDTYTLTSANVGSSSVTNLDSFGWHEGWHANASKKGLDLWSNYFYPLDNVASAGTDGHDVKFGEGYENAARNMVANHAIQAFDATNNTKVGPNASDDGKAHNHYFGMSYNVSFTLTEDYIGPLEYIFYGDDDMWVFLSDDDGKTGRLICDIGGVHGAVGEYVNLWDYIDKGSSSGVYTLYFFYTERGASGSCCWMQFTLPSVSFRTPEQTTGNLEVTKKVTDVTNNDLFGFEIKFTDDKGKDLRNNYSYTQYGADGSKIKDDVLIWNGGKFQLKAGERIEIIYLPIGTHYTITEIGPVEYTEETVKDADGKDVLVRTVLYDENGNYKHKKTDDYYVASASSQNSTITNQQGTDSTGRDPEDKRIAKGIITDTATKYSVEYVNKYVRKFALPETGGSGTILYTMAGVIVLLGGAGFLYKRKFRERRV